MARLTLNVNGTAETLDINPETPLLWVLRDHLELTGTKYGCGAGECGACTVLLDGEADRSCQTTAAVAAGSEITTIEGLGGENLHPLQQVWIEDEVVQCGYCQPGQLMTAAGLLKANPRPSEEEIVDGMSGVLCRCGTYLRVREAVKKAAERGTP
jgi:aerobic-type carbon monoxide dehydrogenase small subunit (CoxS/CutS family)